MKHSFNSAKEALKFVDTKLMPHFRLRNLEEFTVTDFIALSDNKEWVVAIVFDHFYQNGETNRQFIEFISQHKFVAANNKLVKQHNVCIVEYVCFQIGTQNTDVINFVKSFRVFNDVSKAI